MDTKEKNDHLTLTSDDYIRPLCGCDIANGVIKYCSKHKAAPRLYEALKKVSIILNDVDTHWAEAIVRDMVNEALTKAEGK